MAGYSGEFVRLWLGLSSNKVVKVSKLGGGWTGVTLGCQSHCRALLRCCGLVDETLRMEGAHLKTLEMSPTRLNPDGCGAGPLGRPYCSILTRQVNCCC